MAVDFIVELLAVTDKICYENKKSMLYYELEIKTDTGMIYLPIEACVVYNEK